MAAGRQILIVDDDDLFREALGRQMELHEALTAINAATGAEALEKAKSDHFDAIILDIGLPDMDGREVCRLMRRNGVTSPIIMLTGTDSEADTILGLNAGADDYVTKPFHIGILLARLRAHVRRHERDAAAPLTIGAMTFVPEDRVIVNDRTGEKIRLTAKETAILKYLCLTNDRPAGRDELLAEVWEHNAGVETHTLDTHIYRLRRKIEADPSNPRHLIAERGGYRLVR